MSQDRLTLDLELLKERISMLIEPASENTGKLRRRIIKGIVALVVLALLGGTGFILFMKIKFADFQPQFPPANVVVVPATQKQFIDSIEAIGTTVAGQSAVLTATVTETIKSINVEEGEFVTKGTSIVDLNDGEEAATLSEAEKSYRRYDNLARSNLGSAERRDEEEASMNVAKAQLEKRKITAPFDGFLGVRHLNVGDLVTPGTTVTTIDSIDPIKLDFAVPEVYLSAVKVGMEIAATTAAWPDDVFKGQIYVIDSRVDPDTRSIVVRATMPNPDHKLKAGLLMKISIIKASRQSLAVPESAIVASGDKKSVLVVGQDKKVQEKTVITGQREPGYVEITSGLAAGDKVIVEGQMKTFPGSEVNIAAEKKIEDVIGDSTGFALPRKQQALKENAQTDAGGQ